MLDQIFMTRCVRHWLPPLRKAINNKVDGDVKVADMPTKAIYNEM